ncbi:formate-dependent phosphoribosylglycinamide formyltransferase [Bifidobacterium sp. B4142]|uniref:formate-dependent phosphoribosylglycinamide formyltransferase n=1 Tax=Bifidobacterium sp. B4142 TaxID=2817962 RepID=UPI00383540AA|nr:formate-dependent phosphoribosylglycinamide formyltransferase [Bifidobacterium sp. B4142]
MSMRASGQQRIINTIDPGKRSFGSPLGPRSTRVLLLGAGELGREIAMSLMRLGAWVGAADSYPGAPATQVAHVGYQVRMSDPQALEDLIEMVKPDLIVPEVEAIATDRLAGAAARGIQVVPAAPLAAMCMDRRALRVFAHEQVGLPTTPYQFASSLEELARAADQVGYPCMVKPLMSSSGHGQTLVRSREGLSQAWNSALTQGRAAIRHQGEAEIIVEALAPLAHELTVLTVASSAGVATCTPIGQRQENGDYRLSWQPAELNPDILQQARSMATRLVHAMTSLACQSGETGWGVYGVEIFVLRDGSLLFNEVAPRPHDTGMVTMISQRLTEFDLHARAILGIPVHQEDLALSLQEGAYAVSRPILVRGQGPVSFQGLPQALDHPGTDLRIFSKPEVLGLRRMGVALAQGPDLQTAQERAEAVAGDLKPQVGSEM